MAMFMLDIRSLECVPRCEHYLCKNMVKKTSILVCTDCNMHFCIGSGTINLPLGHARWHANLENHWVASWLFEPEVLYCFVCERRTILTLKKLELDSMDVETSASSSEAGHCGHFSCDEERFNEILSKISSPENAPACHYQRCPITGESRLMVCTKCNMNLCARAQAKKRPLGHARRHALKLKHWVGLWYSDPYTVYCFVCEDSFFLKNYKGRKVVDNKADDHAPGLAKGGYLIRGMPNFGNTCYLNALLQCLLVLGKLRARMLGPDAPLGILGMGLKELFEDANNVNHARRQLNPTKLLACVRVLDSRFVGNDMQDSHELLCSLRNGLDKDGNLMIPHKQRDGAPSSVSPTVIDSIFGGQLSVATSCRCCSYTSTSHEIIYDISVPLPSERPPPKSTASPPMNKGPRSRRKIRIKIARAITKGNDSHITGLELGGPLGVDSTKLEQIPGDIVQKATKAGGLEQSDSAGLDKMSSKPEVSIEANKNAHAVEAAAEDKGKAQSSNIAVDMAKDNNSLASIEECLALHFNAEVLGWTCENCSKVTHHMSTATSEHTIASTSENTKIDRDQTEQSDKMTCQGITSGRICGEQDLASDNKANKGHECHQASQQALPSCLPAEKPGSMLDQGTRKKEKLEVSENQKEQKDRNEGGIQTRFFSKVPPVLAIHLKRSMGAVKVKGHVSFKEILDLRQFMDPSSEDKDDCNYRLVGVIEHRGPSTNSGHWVAYVKENCEQPDRGSSSWFCASDTDIREASLEEVLKCEASLLFYEKIDVIDRKYGRVYRRRKHGKDKIAGTSVE